MKNLLILFILYASYASTANAGAPLATNVNKVDDIFDKNIENKEQLFRTMEQDRGNAINSLESKEAIGIIPGMEKSETHIEELNSISETDLDNAGRSKRASEEFKFYDENEFEPDYTKPGNIQHKQDADDIAAATGKVLDDIMLKLKELKVDFKFDCETVKGPVVREPTYLIDIKREEQKNTEFDQFFCEEPRNKYNCHNSLNLRCTRRGVPGLKYVTVPFSAIPSSWVRHPEGYNIYHTWVATLQPHVFYWEALSIISSRIGRSDIMIPYQNITIGFGSVCRALYSLYHEGASELFGQPKNPQYQFSHPLIDGTEDGKIELRLHYIHNEGECVEWAEDWTERCTLQ